MATDFEKLFEAEKALRLELDDCNAPFCLDVPGCVCSPEQKASYKKENDGECTK